MKTLALCVLAAQPWLRRDVAMVVDALHGPPDPSPPEPSQALYAGLLDQARRYLARQARPVALSVFFFDSLQDWRQALQDPAHGLRHCSQELFVLQSPDADQALQLPAQLRAFAHQAGQPLRCSPHSFLLYLQAADDDLHEQPSALWPAASTGGLHLRLAHPEAAMRRADLLRVLLDHLDHAHHNRLLARSVDAAERPPALARALHAFMQQRWPGRWDFHGYTGSVIAAFIEGMRQLGRADGRPQLGSVNEHGLACSAMAGWQLFGRAFVMAVTSGMVDEFKGTLANLQRTRAPGFIVCADSARGQWHAFQGTVEQAGDGRALMQARGLPQVYIETVEQLEAGLLEAFAALARDEGPVVVFASPAVLESGVALDEQGLIERSQPPPRQAAPCVDEARWQALLSLVNDERRRLLWFCGRLGADERALVHEIAQRAGIALCDGIAHPGSVASHAGGREQPNYLGTLGLYGFSRAVHRYLHEGETLRPVEAQSLFFLKSRIDQICTPFSEGRLARHLHIVQVTNRGQDLAPFADLPLQMDLLDFLQRLKAGLQVEADVRRWRQDAIAQARRCPPEHLVDRIETLPMTANYFFHRLGGLLRRLIEEEGLRYHGVYDVGRCGVSALRNVPRTDPGFSGWYGRALMGDALMALPAIALHSPRQVLAFIGDGARALVPDVELQLLRQMGQRPDAADVNVSVFYLHNGMLSIIQSYIDLRFARDGAAQVHVPWRPRGDAIEPHGPLTLQRRRLLRFDEARLREDLLARGRLNVYEVQLTHNSSGDGMSLASEGTWSRITPSEEHAP